jgi:hypothetical protein
MGMHRSALNWGIAAAALMAAVSARAQDSRLLGDLTIGAFSPTYGVVTLPVAANTGTLSISSLPWSLAAGQDFSAGVSTALYGGEVGVFARVSDRPTLLAAQPATSYNIGAAVGYAGFYLQGALAGANDRIAQTLLPSSWHWLQAGLGYGVGSLDVRLTYSMAQGSPAFSGARSFDNNQWMLGGIYQLSPAIRLNADAFYGEGFATLAAPATAVGPSAPQGTGARVGVQLKF